MQKGRLERKKEKLACIDPTCMMADKQHAALKSVLTPPPPWHERLDAALLPRRPPPKATGMHLMAAMWLRGGGSTVRRQRSGGPCWLKPLLCPAA
jgi:hypothetical protein